MSGICGVFHRDGAPGDQSTISRMLDALRHRGPDRSGWWSSGPVSFGHCALQITPESFHETLPLARGSNAITCDGRLDNRAELIADLMPGSLAAEVSDSELILAAYEKWEQGCVDRLLGDFAFALWDGKRKELFFACDPMGVKTLYYHLTPLACYFASEVKALIALPAIPQRLNELRVAEYLVSLFEDRTGTFYQDIHRLPGGHTLLVTPDSTITREYWLLDGIKELRLSSDDEYVEAFRSEFTESVRRRMRSAVPVGAALSGGLDSSSIACVARNLLDEGSGPLHTFSLVFPDLPAEDRRVIDERNEMQAVLDTGGFEPHFIRADALSPMREVDRMQYHLDHANCAPNLYLHWAMYGAARDAGVKVFLDGFDGDGCVSHGFERLAQLAQNLRWFKLWREVNLLSKNHLAGVRRRRIVRKFCIRPLMPRWIHLAWQMGRGRWREALSQNILISSDFKRRTRIEERARALLHDQVSYSLRRTPLDSHRESIRQALYSYTLEIADKASAAFGIEARYPFFDRRLLELCLSLPVEQKLGAGWNRWVQRRAMSGVLPESIQWRPRKGNLSPNFHRRLLDFEREKLEEVASGGCRELEPFIDAESARSAWREYQKNHVHSQGESFHLFAAANLARWLRAARFGS